MSFLFDACQKGDVEQVKFLIERQCDIDQVTEEGRTALHYCCEHETIDCAKILLENESIKNSIINRQDNEGFSALHLACLNGNAVMVKYLCEQQGDVKLVDYESHSIFHWVTVCGHIDLFDILVQYQAPIHTCDIYGAFPIHYASQLCGNKEPVKRLAILNKIIDNNADVDCLDEQKRTPFLWAASANATDALRTLYKAGANPLHADKDSLTALHCAATCGHISCIRMLVELYGCPLESEDVNGCTALFYAITLEHSNACRILLDLKANPNHKDNRGRTPSHCAALKGNIDCLKFLIEYNGDIWVKNKRGDYPIHEAINAVSLSKLRNQNNDQLQLQKGCSDVVRFILQLYPKKINIQNDENRSPLHLAASLGDINMCNVLIECGARVNSFIQTSAGNFLTAYDLARIRHQNTCAEYLLSNYGGQRGNLLANIFARRIQKSFRQYKMKKSSIENEHQKQLVVTNQTDTNRNSSASEELSSRSNIRKISIIKSTNHLLNQANVCLHNKMIEDHFKELKINIPKLETYVSNSSKAEKHSARQRRSLFAESKGTMTSINRSDDQESTLPKRIIIHASSSIATSVRLYERHKLIAEELYKFKKARIHNTSIVINRQLYKILIENAFDPHSRCATEIEEYLEKLLKAYETELEAIRKRTKSVPPIRVHNCSQRNNPVKLSMEDTGIDNNIDDKKVASKTTERRSTKTKSAPKALTDETEIPVKSTEKKRKAPKTPTSTTDTNEYEEIYESKAQETPEIKNKTEETSIQDQEVSIKSKKKRAPKIETANETNELVSTDEPMKKKKSKAPKASTIDDNAPQEINTPSLDTLEPSTEIKSKEKKTKKSKLPSQPPALSDSFENLQVTNLDDIYSPYSDTNDAIPILDNENLPPPENTASEYTQEILNSYNALAANVDFSRYVGDDQWHLMHLPKSARVESKSLMRKILPGGHNKDEKQAKKSAAPKGSIFNRIRAGVSTLVGDEKNLIFGEQSKYEMVEYEEEDDEVDTDDLNRYAQKLRELEDHDREINPEFLVIGNGKAVYGVHEADTDGKVKLASRKPIYDRFADQTVNEQTEKRRLLSRLKLPFGRNRDKDGKESKSANGTPNTDKNRKATDDDRTAVTIDDNPLMNSKATLLLGVYESSLP
ncbi:unnamed protein product [Rotaria socialis]|uniref:Inversin n=2 Tax=Rotaria socialis TaxID=392032 RepID=A0A821KS52_9BILA|nr:unnamed protein product [Rotaria socialis]CAF4229295.1 unnamed protein product [Rotaria socialis]CAF4742487.1 unnamed protein product [Rotaria socialis]